MLSFKLKPFLTKSLIRLGHNSDGGYIINNEILDKSKTLLTFGLADEFSFEKDYKSLKPDNKIIVYDHTVANSFWFKHFINWFFHFVRNQKNFFRMFRYFKYLSFFKKKKVTHYKTRVREHANNIIDSISVKEIISKENILPKETILKIDIDMDEYRILDDILEFDFLSILIEFTHTDLHMDKILYFLNKAKNYKIIHIHGNNFDSPDKNRNPIHLEITMSNKNYTQISDNNIDYKLPIEGLDFPSDNKNAEIPITFSSSQ
jgi:hypothetical protein